jgi:hypothetical protein
MTMYEDAFLSLTDFQNSPAEILFFPKTVVEDEKVRSSEVWKRGDYELLSKGLVDGAVENFLSARDIARRHLADEAQKWDKSQRSEITEKRPPANGQGELEV